MPGAILPSEEELNLIASSTTTGGGGALEPFDLREVDNDKKSINSSKNDYENEKRGTIFHINTECVFCRFLDYKY